MLKSGGNLLLLDEPTNDLDVDTLRALEEALLDFAGCAVVISHDRWFLDRIATHILAFEGDSQVVWFEGNYQAYEADRKRRLGAEADQPHRIRYKKSDARRKAPRPFPRKRPTCLALIPGCGHGAGERRPLRKGGRQLKHRMAPAGAAAGAAVRGESKPSPCPVENRRGPSLGCDPVEANFIQI